MNKLLSVFFDRLAERLTALAAGLVSSRVEGLHAAAQAEQQSDLEDLARQYEADGKVEIAATLRDRLTRIGSPDLASEAIEVLQHVTLEPGRLPSPNAQPASPELKGLPNFAATPPCPKKKSRPPIKNLPPQTGRGAES